MPFALSHHRRPRSVHPPGAAAMVLYMLMMYLLMALVEAACMPAISHASLHEGEGLAWIVLGVAAYRLGSRYRYPNGAFLFGMASAVIFLQRYLHSAPAWRALSCGATPELFPSLIGWFVYAIFLGLLARLLASLALQSQTTYSTISTGDSDSKRSEVRTKDECAADSVP